MCPFARLGSLRSEENPIPSSSTSRRTRSSSALTRRLTRFACACRSTFRNASRDARNRSDSSSGGRSRSGGTSTSIEIPCSVSGVTRSASAAGRPVRRTLAG